MTDERDRGQVDIEQHRFTQVHRGERGERTESDASVAKSNMITDIRKAQNTARNGSRTRRLAH